MLQNALLSCTFHKLICFADRCNSHRPQKDHTEIEEELHETAHIDYDRVAIVGLSSNLEEASTQLTLETRLPTRQSLLFMRMRWYMRQDLPLPHQALFQLTLGLKLDGPHLINVSLMKPNRVERSGGARLINP